MGTPGVGIVLVLVIVLALIVIGPHFTTGGGWQLMPITREPWHPWGPRHHFLMWVVLAIVVAVLLNLAGII